MIIDTNAIDLAKNVIEKILTEGPWCLHTEEESNWKHCHYCEAVDSPFISSVHHYSDCLWLTIQYVGVTLGIKMA